jgi:hypothetical protein
METMSTIGDKVKVMDLNVFWPTYELWSMARDFPALHRENVEEVIICKRNNNIIYSCFVWNTNTKMCLIGIPLANPYLDKKFRRGGLTKLIEGMSLILRERGYTKMWTTSNTPPVMEALEANQFIKADPNVHVYIKMM